MDMARSIQDVTEEVMLRLARTLHRDTGADYLCMAGGVALNWRCSKPENAIGDESEDQVP
jgi:predicted NodU family carbamoyl transferase